MKIFGCKITIGDLTIIIGPMFSGKSAELKRLYDRSTIAGRKTIVLNAKVDTRAGEGGSRISIHDGRMITSLGIASIEEILTNPAYQGFTDYFIDEGQFISDMSLVRRLLEKGLNITIATLDADYNQRRFLIIDELIPHALSVIKLTSICGDCGSEKAIYSVLRHAPKSAKSHEIIIGGADRYRALCRRCLLRLQKLSETPEPSEKKDPTPIVSGQADLRW